MERRKPSEAASQSIAKRPTSEDSAFDRFERLTNRLLSVPKKEIKEQEEKQATRKI